jgi:hypothetical protein
VQLVGRNNLNIAARGPSDSYFRKLHCLLRFTSSAGVDCRVEEAAVLPSLR